VLWKNIIYLKKTNAVARRKSFKTGDGPPLRPETDELGDLLTGIIDSQHPLEEADDHHSLDGIRQDEGQPTTSAAARREDCVTKPGRRTKTKRLCMHEKLAMEFHEHKLMYLKEEPDMKM
ncbi:unnamed protein product, partial [Coregonus sp. 'balchen']